MHQGCSHGGIDSSGESADGPALFSYCFFDLANGFLDEVLRRPVSTGPADVVDKVAQQIGPQTGVMYLGMKLHRPDSSRFILNGSQRIAAAGHYGKTRWKFLSFISVGHPHVERVRKPIE